MNGQNIFVGIIILAAFAYVLMIVVRKAASFNSKFSCGGGCGCSSKTSHPGKKKISV